MLSNANANAKKAKRTQRNTKERIFGKKPRMKKVSTRAAAAYGRQLKIKGVKRHFCQKLYNFISLLLRNWCAFALNHS